MAGERHAPEIKFSFEVSIYLFILRVIMAADRDRYPLNEEQGHAPPQITPPPELPAAPPKKAITVVVLVVVVLALCGAASMFTRIRAGRALAKETETDAVSTVLVVYPQAEKPDEELVLPASLQAYEESPIYARTNGYLLRWYKDIGSRVNKGELLAEIDTPEVDQELSQARALKQQSAAQLELAKISADRFKNLRKTDAVSQQETDTQSSAFQQAEANMAAVEANVRRLEELESFKRVYAPFSGVLIKRNVDPGALISAGGAGTQLFTIAKDDPLRVYVNVPQAYFTAIKDGMPAYITVPEMAGQKFSGTVTRTANAIDPATRTLLTEVDVPNKGGRLLSGTFGEVHFSLKIDVAKVTVPVNTMLFRQEGPQVAVVGPDNKVHLRPIVIGHDYGTTLEVLGGVDAHDRIIINPSDSLEEGQTVNVTMQNQAGSHS
jgi:RND family efflux transporter MFP subunit